MKSQSLVSAITYVVMFSERCPLVPLSGATAMPLSTAFNSQTLSTCL
jgi:hypothetical protein